MWLVEVNDNYKLQPGLVVAGSQQPDRGCRFHCHLSLLLRTLSYKLPLSGLVGLSS